jgi:LysM repeat protein
VSGIAPAGTAYAVPIVAVIAAGTLSAGEVHLATEVGLYVYSDLPTGYSYPQPPSGSMIPVTPGQIIDYSVYVSATGVTSGVAVGLMSQTPADVLVESTVPAGAAGFFRGSYTVPSSGVTGVCLLLDTGNCTIPIGEQLVFAMPQIVITEDWQPNWIGDINFASVSYWNSDGVWPTANVSQQFTPVAGNPALNLIADPGFSQVDYWNGGGVWPTTLAGALWEVSGSNLPFVISATTINTDHSQYMQVNGIGHDTTANHLAGSGPSFSINTNNVESIPPSHWGDVAAAGGFTSSDDPNYDLSGNPANSMHVHGRESIAELVQGIWPAGTMVLWGGGAIPPGWLATTGLDVRSDLAPQLFQQIGFGAGTAIDWYPPAPVFPVYIGEHSDTLVDPLIHATVTADIPYVYMWDPRLAVMYLPPDSNVYFKTPNLGTTTLPGLPSTVQWIIKVDYGYTWTPRPKPPASSPLYVTPYSVDTTYPYGVAVAGGSKVGSSTKYTVGTWPTGYTWGYDAVMGIPAVMGSAYIGPGNLVTGPILIPVYPYGAPLPSGTMLFPDQLLAEQVLKDKILAPPVVEIIKIVPIPPPPPAPHVNPPPKPAPVSIFSLHPPQETPPPAPKPAPPKVAKPTAGPRTYVVVPGDNLYDIALRFGIVPWTLIEDYNPLIPSITGSWNLIYPGMVINLGPTPAPPAPKARGTYTVRSGDNLYDIGLKFGLSLAEIESFNPQIPATTGSFNLVYPGMIVFVS